MIHAAPVIRKDHLVAAAHRTPAVHVVEKMMVMAVLDAPVEVRHEPLAVAVGALACMTIADIGPAIRMSYVGSAAVNAAATHYSK